MTPNPNGLPLVRCHVGCSQEAVLDALRERGLWPSSAALRVVKDEHYVYDDPRRIAIYPYCQPDATLDFEVHRYTPKAFRPWVKTSRGWVSKRGDATLLYRLPELMASDVLEPVYLPGGEKAVDAVHSLGLTATCQPFGEHGLTRAQAQRLAGRHVVLLPHNDDAGAKEGREIPKVLQGIAASVKVVYLPGLPPKGDVYDWIEQGGTKAQLVKLAKGAELYDPHREALRDVGIISATDLLAMDIPEPQCVIDGVLPVGMSLLAGKGKIGKSWLLLGAGVAVASDGKALGGLDVAGGDVLMLALEDHHRRLQKRLRAILADGTLTHTLDFVTKWPRLDDGGLEQIDAWLATHPGGRLVTIDIWPRVSPRRKRNDDPYQADYNAATDVKALADRYPNVAILVSMHMRKADAEDFVDTLNATSGIGGAADTIMAMFRTRGQAEAVLKITSRDLDDDTELALTWDTEISGWRSRGDAGEYKQSTERLAIEHAVRDAGRPVAPRDIYDALGKTTAGERSNVRTLMGKMVAAGRLRLVNGLYVLNAPYAANAPYASYAPYADD